MNGAQIISIATAAIRASGRAGNRPTTAWGRVQSSFQIVFSLHNVTFALAIGLGSAAGVRAGNAVGEGGSSASPPPPSAPRAGRETGRPPPGAGSRATGCTAPPFILFDGIQVVLVYALRSLNDQVAAGINSIVAYFPRAGRETGRPPPGAGSRATGCTAPWSTRPWPAPAGSLNDQVAAGINSIVAYFLVTGGLGWWLVSEGWGGTAQLQAAGPELRGRGRGGELIAVA
jgi:MATE family multidrug resistance protein